MLPRMWSATPHSKSSLQLQPVGLGKMSDTKLIKNGYCMLGRTAHSYHLCCNVVSNLYHLTSECLHATPRILSILWQIFSCPTWFVDKNGIIFGYRTDVPAWMTERVQSTAGDAGEAHREVDDDGVLNDNTLNSDSPRREPTSLLEDIGSQCVTFIIVCGDILDSVAKENRRGLHWFCVTGVDRQISSVSVNKVCPLYRLTVHCS